MISNKSRILMMTALTGCLLAIGVIAYMLYMPHRDIQHETPVVISAEELAEVYYQDEDSANSRFLDKVLQVSGLVEDTEKNDDGKTVVTLSGINPLSGVRCTLQEEKMIEKGKPVTLKGRCTGYLSDVVVIDCLIVK